MFSHVIMRVTVLSKTFILRSRMNMIKQTDTCDAVNAERFHGKH